MNNNSCNNFRRNQHNNWYQYIRYADYNYHDYYGQNTMTPGQAWFERNWYQSNINTMRHRNRTQQYKNNYNNDMSQNMLIHINKLRVFLEDEKEIYLDFIGLNLNECDFVYNLHRISRQDLANFSYKVQPAIAELCDILTNIKNKFDIDVICEENSNRNLRNVTYSKIFTENPPVKDDVQLPAGKSPDKGEEQSKEVDNEKSKEVKTVTKEELYFKQEFENDSEGHGEVKPDCEWTDGIWHKSNSRENSERELKKDVMTDKRTDKRAKVKHSSNKHINKMIEACSTPMESSSKAERMMQLMGWQGGALGATGEGITEPIVPSVAYKHGSGLGHTNAPTKRKVEAPNRLKRKVQKPTRKSKIVIDQSVFNTNVLTVILDFVIDDQRTELKFDTGLRPIDRKNIHCIIEKLRTGSDVDYDDMEQVSLVAEIYKNMDCVLETESHGLGKQRQLHVYKAAPENVYLITPKDLSESEKNEITTEAKSDNPAENAASITIEDSSEDETDHVSNIHSGLGYVASTLAYIKREELKNKCSKKTLSMDGIAREDRVRKLLVSYIVEFCKDDTMEELRFLGNFDSDDAVTINSLMVDIIHCVRSGQFENIFDDSDLEYILENPQFGIEVKNKEREGSVTYVLCKTKKN